MKILFTFLFSLVCVQLCYGQDAVDKEKLLTFYQSQQYADAAQYLQTVYPPDTKDIKALSQMGYCLMMAGKLTDAEQKYMQIDALQPNTMPVLFNLASINIRRGNFYKAKSYLENIIKIDSVNFNALKQLANFADSVPLKINYLTRANKLNPVDPDVASDLAYCYRIKKQYEPAYNVLKIAIAADTSNFILQLELLPIGNELKKYKEVISVGERILKNDKDENVLKEVGKAYYFQKNYEKCLFYYKMIEDMAKQNELILYYMTLSYRELKNYEKATIYANKTIAEGISPNTETYYSLLGGIYEMSDELSKAVVAYKRGLTFNANGNTYYKLALINDLKLKQKNTALNYYQLYLKSKPDANKDKELIYYTKGRVAELKKGK
jgi:tetratricopeptide (TPR) repeat protein